MIKILLHNCLITKADEVKGFLTIEFLFDLCFYFLNSTKFYCRSFFYGQLTVILLTLYFSFHFYSLTLYSSIFYERPCHRSGSEYIFQTVNFHFDLYSLSRQCHTYNPVHRGHHRSVMWRREMSFFKNGERCNTD